MAEFRFYYPIQVRYSDLDPQWHVNNARFLSYFEQTRFAYLVELGLFDGHSFFDLGLIVADVHVAYLAPIKPFQQVRVGMRVARIGNKSLTLEYLAEDASNGQALAQGETVMVAFDYHSEKSIPVPAHWRETIARYEGLPFE